MMDSEQQELVAQFCGITGATPSAAQTALSAAEWDLGEAVALYYAAGDEAASQEESSPSTSSQAAPQPAASSSNARRTQPSSRLRTLRDLQGSANDEDDEEEKDQDMFAGGEKSGLAVQNPNSGGGPPDHFRNILNQARQNRDRPAAQADEDETPRQNNFTGRAQTLGGDEAPSRVIEDAQGSRRRAPLERINRTLHLWTDGVSVDDGPLFRFDDPNNAHIMQQINRGQAPLSLLDVQPDQEVDLTLEPHKDEAYVQPKKKYTPFGGQGQRLGSPVPGLAGPSVQAAAAQPATSTNTTPAAAVEVDENQPVIQIQIRLGDGSRLTSRFNATHTVGDVYGYVDQASTAARAYALMTTFPSTELKDRAQVLGDINGFKRGGVLVQKYT